MHYIVQQYRSPKWRSKSYHRECWSIEKRWGSERNRSIADSGVNIRDWYGIAIAFLLGNSEQKPFPWKSI